MPNHILASEPSIFTLNIYLPFPLSPFPLPLRVTILRQERGNADLRFGTPCRNVAPHSSPLSSHEAIILRYPISPPIHRLRCCMGLQGGHHRILPFPPMIREKVPRAGDFCPPTPVHFTEILVAGWAGWVA